MTIFTTPGSVVAAAATVSAEEKQALIDVGYRVEDMNAEYGWAYKGQYRWMNDRHETNGGDGYGVIQYSENDAWADAKQYQEQQLGIPLWIPEGDVHAKPITADMIDAATAALERDTELGKPASPQKRVAKLPHPADLQAGQFLLEVEGYLEYDDGFICKLHDASPHEGRTCSIPAPLLPVLVREFGEPHELVGRTFLVQHPPR